MHYANKNKKTKLNSSEAHPIVVSQRELQNESQDHLNFHFTGKIQIELAKSRSDLWIQIGNHMILTTMDISRSWTTSKWQFSKTFTLT